MGNELIALIVSRLEAELPTYLKQNIQKFLDCVNKKEYRPAFLILENLRHSCDWTPSNTLLEYYEKFWWEYAN